MAQVAVSVKNVSKKFRLFNSPRERLFEAIHPFNKKYHKEFWALKNINFEIEKGQTVGIIGRNGSGKSTLLQIICSILKPTSGEVIANGRISALLELGAGFNPEFTGRQNVLMKGMLMGFSAQDMNKRMPDIEAFADIGDFIDQPVKIYSSGMFVRLAFAVSINVDPDILIVDEALAVGDAKFQHKCYSKFLEFQKSGKTIVLVTHDTSAIVKHCDTAILLERGEIIDIGEPKTIVNYYVDLLFTGKIPNPHVPSVLPEGDHKPNAETISDQVKITELDEFLAEVPLADNCMRRKSYNKNEYRQGDRKAEILDYLIVCGDQYDPTHIYSGDKIDIYIKARFYKNVKFPLFGFSIKTMDGILIYALNTYFIENFIHSAKESDVIVSKFSVKMGLNGGDFFIDLGIDESFDIETHQLADKPFVYESLDRRCSIIHLFVQEKQWFHGYVNLEAAFQEMARNGKAVV